MSQNFANFDSGHKLEHKDTEWTNANLPSTTFAVSQWKLNALMTEMCLKVNVNTI